MKKNHVANKWAEFLNNPGYNLANLGRPAIFLLPTKKLKRKFRNTSVEKDLHGFLVNNFGAYTTSLISNFGFWKSDTEMLTYDECREYEVSFAGKEKIPLLLAKVASISAYIGEDCIYFKAGQYACLVYPSKKKRV